MNLRTDEIYFFVCVVGFLGVMAYTIWRQDKKEKKALTIKESLIDKAAGVTHGSYQYKEYLGGYSIYKTRWFDEQRKIHTKYVAVNIEKNDSFEVDYEKLKRS